MKSNVFLFLFVFYYSVYGQQEKEKWTELENPYLGNYPGEIKYSESQPSAGLITSIVNVYRFFISSQDGDNCPFYPSCSHFLEESVERTNIMQGILMTADRFTRDTNLINRGGRYPFIVNNRHYDPPDLYTLDYPEYPPRIK